MHSSNHSLLIRELLVNLNCCPVIQDFVAAPVIQVAVPAIQASVMADVLPMHFCFTADIQPMSFLLLVTCYSLMAPPVILTGVAESTIDGSYFRLLPIEIVS